PAARADDAERAKRAQSGAHGRTADADLPREVALGRKPRAGAERAAVDQLPDVRDDRRRAVVRVMPLSNRAHDWIDQLYALPRKIANISTTAKILLPTGRANCNLSPAIGQAFTLTRCRCRRTAASRRGRSSPSRTRYRARATT